jgi:hypothetical protein
VVSSTAIKARGLTVSVGISHCSDAMIGTTGTYGLQRLMVNAASLREAAHLAKLAERACVGVVLPWVYEQWLLERFVLRFLGKADFDGRLMYVAEMMAPQHDKSWETEGRGIREMIAFANDAMVALTRGDPEPGQQMLAAPRVPTWLADELRNAMRTGCVPTFQIPVVW